MKYWAFIAAISTLSALLALIIVRLKLSSERVKHLTALEASNDAFRDVVSNQPVGIYRLRVKADNAPFSAAKAKISYEFVSDRYCAMLGIDRERLLADSGLPLRQIHPDDYERFITAKTHAFREKVPFSWEGRMILKGQIRWMHFESQPRESDHGDTLWTGFLHEITERKETEEQALRSELKYRALFEHAGDYLLVLSPPSASSPPLIIDANTAAMTRHGFSRDELIGKPIFMIDTPAAAAKNKNIVAQMQVNGAPLLFNSEHLCRDGSTFPVEVLARMIQIGDEPPIILAIERDMTERAKAEASLRRSEERFRVLFDKVANIAVQGYGPDGTVRFWNKASEELYGYTAGEAVGANLLDLIIPPAMREVVSGAITSMFERGEGVPSSELELMRKDGSTVPVYSNHTIVDISGSGKELYCLDIDLSGIKKAEGHIEHLNQILRTLRFVDKLILQEKEAKGFIEKVCHLLTENCGYEGAMISVRDQEWTPDIVARSGAEIHCEDNPCTELSSPDCMEVLNSEKGLLRRTKIGKNIYMSLLYEGKVYGCIKAVGENANAIDEEEETLLEDLTTDIAFALHSMEQEYLVAQVRAERDQIEIEMRQAQKMDAVGRLAGGIAHDFNNKLTVILCTAELLLARTTADSPLYKDLLNIRMAGEQSADLTRQLLTFSRKQFTKPKLVDLNGFISAERSILSRLLGEEIDLRFLPVHGLTMISIDPSQLDQVLANLAVNARDAINGAGTITIETSTLKISDSNSKGFHLPVGDYVLLTFSDSGEGMDEETQKAIFDPFFTTKPEGKGTGLGLSTVYGIVKQNLGAIHVESVPGQGTCFRIYFPLCHEEWREAGDSHMQSVSVGMGTILVAEDNELLLNLIESVLVPKGYRTLMAASPEEAMRVSAAYGEEIHLLLSDIVMPNMSGKDLQVRVEEMRPGIKTIFMSGYPSEIITARGVDVGQVHFLPKPFTIDALHQKIHTVLSGAGARSEA